MKINILDRSKIRRLGNALSAHSDKGPCLINYVIVFIIYTIPTEEGFF